MKLLLSIIFGALLIVDVPVASAQIPGPIHFSVMVRDTQPSNSLRDRALINLSAGTKRFAKGEGIAHSDLVLNDLSRGQTYSAIPDGAGSIVLTPSDGVASVISPGQAGIVGGKNAQVVASFVLPQRMYHWGDTSGSSVVTHFSGITAAWGSVGAEVHYFDPRNPITLTLDTSGAASIVLGGIFEVGSMVDSGSYEAEAALIVSGDTVVQHIHFTVTVRPKLLEPVTTDLELANLTPGRTYTATPDGAGFLSLTPIDGVAAVNSAGSAVFVGAPNTQILVTFVLPSRLYPTGGTGSGYVHVRFDSTSATWGDPGAEVHYFDPHIPTTIPLDSAGKATIVLGGIFDVGIDLIGYPDSYEGEALASAMSVTSVLRPPDAPFPKTSKLHQNYPNPFNPTTTFRYQIATTSHVQLRIFDVLGREVATIVNETKAPGDYVAKWDGSSYASGVYYYKLEAGSFAEVKKLVIVR